MNIWLNVHATVICSEGWDEYLLFLPWIWLVIAHEGVAYDRVVARQREAHVGHRGPGQLALGEVAETAWGIPRISLLGPGVGIVE